MSVPTHVQAANDRFCAGLAAGDASAVANVYAFDAELLAPGSPATHGRSSVEAFWKAAITGGVTGATLETERVIQRDDVVVEIGSYALRIAADRGEVTDYGKYVVVHQRAATGEWQWAVDIFNSDRPAD
jgi:uncharacterized protein (TIGR02246 family)